MKARITPGFRLILEATTLEDVSDLNDFAAHVREHGLKYAGNGCDTGTGKEYVCFEPKEKK